MSFITILSCHRSDNVGGPRFASLYCHYLFDLYSRLLNVTHLNAPTRELAGGKGVVPALQVTVHWAPIRILAPGVQPCTPNDGTRLGGKRGGSVQKCGMWGGHFQLADASASGVWRRLLLRTTAASAKPANTPHSSQMATTAIYRALIGILILRWLFNRLCHSSLNRLPRSKKIVS
jgi:hypothetical protein